MKEKYIHRPLYTEKVRPFIGKQLIKIFTGQRRVGKSYIMLQLMDTIKVQYPNANIIYIDKELLSFSEVEDSNSLYDYVSSHLTSGPDFLFIDEVQEIDGFQLCLRSLLNENKCDIYCTGSNAKMLSGELATHLGGRYIEIPVHSLSYREFLEFNNLSESDGSLNHYLTLVTTWL